MKIGTLIKQKRPIIAKGHEKHLGMLHDLAAAIDSNASYPWNLNLDYCHSYFEVESFINRVSFKDIYTFHFGSDEDAIFRVLRLDDEDIAYFTKNGDTRHWHWEFYNEHFEKKFITFIMQIERSLIEPHDEPNYLNVEDDAHSQYLNFTEINGKAYVDGFNGFAWALEKFNRPKIVLLKEGLVPVKVVKWIDDGVYSDDANIVVVINNEDTEINLSKILVELQTTQ